MSDLVWVEMGGECGQVLRVQKIFRSRKAAIVSHALLATMPRAAAVSEIRHQLYERSKGNCELCGDIVTEQSAHMHERKHRGRGGEISLENSVFICYACHLGPRGAHGARRPRFGEHNQ
jgi:hypothetical protein